jgi:LDH2 family malate/lactate/ureidoglycolate dehydrogenase
MNEEVLIELKEVIETTYKAFSEIGFSSQQAFDVTRQLMYGEIRGGKKNHALDRFNWILKQKNVSFFLNKKIIFESLDEDSNCIILNGQHGVGYSHIYEAIICAREYLKRHNSVIIGLKNTYPTNCLGDYASIFSSSGLASYVGSLSPDKVAFPDDGVPVMPTSGQAFGLPTSPPMILDFSIGAITNGDLNYYKKNQIALPIGACLDKAGNQTQDVNDVIDDEGKLVGTILPRGGESASHIMAGFAIMLMTTGLEAGILPNTHGTFLSVRKVNAQINDNWDKLMTKLTNKKGKSMIPGHRSMQLANKALESEKILIDMRKWKPISDYARKYQNGFNDIDIISNTIIDQLQKNHYSSLNNLIEDKYSNFFN